MELELGQHILSADGADVGALKYLILDPENSQVKVVVAEKGWLLADDIEIPVEAIQEKGGEGLYIRYTAEQVKNLPRFDESRYTTTAPDQAFSFSGYPTGGLLWPNASMYPPYFSTGTPLPVPIVDGEMAAPPPKEVQERLRQLDEHNAVISAGDSVLSLEGMKVGEVQQIGFDSVSGRPTHLTLRRGWLFHKEWDVPADAIASVDDGVVYLNLDKAQLQARRAEEQYSTEWSQKDQPVKRR